MSRPLRGFLRSAKIRLLDFAVVGTVFNVEFDDGGAVRDACLAQR